MERKEIGKGITRVVLTPKDAPLSAPVVFSDGGEAFLSLTGFESDPRPVYRLRGGEGKREVVQTANGEVIRLAEGEKDLRYVSRRATLTFACPEGQLLTGLGQQEDGVFDYARESETLYQHNMKIAIPFLLSGAGWGLLLENGCAMRYQGNGKGFTFILDAARTVSFAVIRGEDCADVLRRLSGLTGRPALLPKWAYGYIQSRERYHSAEELIGTAREFRRRAWGWTASCWTG